MPPHLFLFRSYQAASCRCLLPATSLFDDFYLGSALPVGIQLRRHPRNCLPNKSVPNNKYLYIAHYARFCTYLCSATAWFLLLPILSFKSGSKVYIMLFTMQWTCQVYEMDIITRLLSSWAWEQEYAEKYAMYFNVLVNLIVGCQLSDQRASGATNQLRPPPPQLVSMIIYLWIIYLKLQ